MKRTISFIISNILILMGFSACEGSVEKYGCPHVEFNAKGTVKTEDNKPINGIQVIVKANYDSDTVFTNANGEYLSTKFSSDYYLVSEKEIQSIEFKEIDGVENGGNFNPLSLNSSEMNIKQTSKGSDSWDNGDYESDLNITLHL